MKLLGKIIIKGIIETKTGLHIGGSKSSLNIGGIDNNVIKTVRNLPYIPGSSLKGKLRSLLASKEGSLFFSNKEKSSVLKDLEKEKDENPELADLFEKLENAPTDESDNQKYIVELFGYSGDTEDKKLVGNTRVLVRDGFLLNENDSSIFKNGFTQAKYENVINRRTGTAEHPRQMERVPVGAQFSLELVYNIYDDIRNEEGKLFNHLQHIILALHLVEDDFIGGQGSRGYGQIDIKIDMEATMLKVIDGYDYKITNWTLTENENSALGSFKNALANI